jgi:hypothetical protein
MTIEWPLSSRPLVVPVRDVASLDGFMAKVREKIVSLLFVAKEKGACTSLTIAVHVDGEGCDHE